MTTVRPMQRFEALQIANETRMHRADVKAALRSGQVGFWEVIDRRDPRLNGMRLAELLAAVPGWGKVKVERALAQLQVGRGKTVGSMTARQWRALNRVAGAAGSRL